MLQHLTIIKLITQKISFRYLKWKVLSAIFFFLFSSAAVFAQNRYVATTGSNAANDCSLPGSPCQTINYAVSQAVANDIINIAAGTYNESVTVNKALTFQGVGNTTIIDGAAMTASGFFINTGILNVTIKDLRIQNFTAAGACGVRANQANHNLTITNIEVNNCTPSGGFGGIYVNGTGGINNVSITNSTVTNCTSRGIVIWNGFKTNITITGNTVSNNNCCGIELQDGTASGVNISNNTLVNNTDNGIGIVGLQAGSGTGTPNIIENNTLTNNGRFGIEIKLPNGTGLNTNTDGAIIVRNNIVERTVPIGAEVRDLAGIAVFRRSFVVGNGNVNIPNGVYVTNNTVRGYNQPSTSDGFGIVVEGTNMTVINNTLQNNDVGVQSQQGHTPYLANTNTDGNQNNLADTYFGRGNSPTTSCINLGTNTFTTNTINIRSVGVTGNAVTNTNTGVTFCSIQSAIDAATTLNGHTLSLSAGTYTENNILVNKELTIVGTGNGTNPAVDVIIDPASGGATGFRIFNSNVTIQNMRIQGASFGITTQNVTVNNILLDQLAITNMASEGISFQSTSTNGTGIQNVTISNSTFSQNGTGNAGNGDISFFKFNGNATLSNITVTNGTGHVGLQLRGWDNGNANPLLRFLSFQPAGNVSLNNVSIEGSYKRLAFPITVAGAPMYISGYSANLNNFTFNDVSLTSVASDNAFLRTCLYVSEMIAAQTLNLGNTKFTLKAILPFTPIERSNYIVDNTQVISINATASDFYLDAALIDKTDINQAFFIEDYILHGIDANNVADASPFTSYGGFVQVRTGYAYITLNSFLPTVTAEPSIQRAVQCSSDGFIVMIQKNGLNALGNPYDEYIVPATVNKTLTFQTDAANYTETTLKDITMNGVGKTLTFDGNFGISQVLNMQDGDVVVAGGTNFALRSTTTQTAMVVNASTTNTVQGDVIMERLTLDPTTITGFVGTYNGTGYSMFSSPFTNSTVSQFGDDVGLVLTPSYNTSLDPTYTVPFPNFFRYNTTRSINGSASGIFNPFTMGYEVPLASDNLEVGRGYEVRLNTGTLVDLNGTLNNGTVNIPLTDIGTSYNLIGNPYPSPIKWSTVYGLSTGVDPTISIDIKTGLYAATFATYNALTNMSVNGGTDDIASMQGFFVNASGAGGQVVMNNTVRPTTYQDTRFFKTKKTEIAKEGVIKLGLSSQGSMDETAIGFIDGATSNHDNLYDAQKIHRINGYISTLYSYNKNDKTSENEYYAINVLPKFDEDMILPLAMNIVKSGKHKIVVREIKYFHSLSNIYLYDSLTETLHDLKANPEYEFVAQASKEVKRFVILFKTNQNFIQKDYIVAYPNPASTTFSYSLKNDKEGIHTIRLFDVSGKLILERTEDKQGAFLEGTINLEKQPIGLYLLQISNPKSTTNVRIIKD